MSEKISKEQITLNRYLLYTAPHLEAIRIKLVKTQCGYLHSAFGYRTPNQVEEEYYRNRDGDLLNAA